MIQFPQPGMLLRCAIFASTLIGAFMLSGSHRGCAEEDFDWSGPGCVLLKNGNVLTAKNIVSQHKQLAVQLDDTGEVRIPNKDVVTIGRDRLDLYHFQVSKTPRWGAGEHWQLAKWCLRQGLVEQSHAHYEQLKSISGDHAKFKQLDSELRLALLQDPVMKAALQSAFPSTQLEMATLASTSPGSPAELHDASTEDSSPGRPALAGDPPNPRSGDRYSQDYFRTQIQSFLAMRCGQAGCHGAFGRSDFHVAKSGSLHGQRASDISWDSALRFLDHENVEATNLWLKATHAHGNQTTPSLTTKIAAERDLLNRIRFWHQTVYRTANLARAPVQSASDASKLGPSTATGSMALAAPAVVSPTSPIPKESGAKVDMGDDLLILEREIAKLEEIERGRKSSRRHDPEEFNRRFGTTAP